MNARVMEERRRNANNNAGKRSDIVRFFLFIKRHMKLNRFLLVIDTKKGVTISSITVIVCNLSMIDN